ncbi:MAG TPA: phosphoenolpyruvate--protein phosphotransferase [Thermoanaerobaculia bacterium]|jgi:phosphotransferase system enzyme I (PtsI)
MLQGLSVSPGLAVGRAVIIRFAGLPALRRAIGADEVAAEQRRLRRAAGEAGATFARHSKQATGAIGSELAAILEAHGLIATDETYLGAIVERIRRDKVNAEWALAEITRELSERLAAADSAAMREREADLADVGREISTHLSGGVRPGPGQLPRGSILVADELSPADAARLDPRRVRALALERGGPTSHSSIIARSFGLPAVVGIPGLCDAVPPERPILVDGDRGVVEIHPSRQRLRASLLKVRESRERSRRVRVRTAKGAMTRDGERIAIRANLELPEEIPALERFHAEGIGLFRSEFLYLRALPRSPGVEEQRAAYETLLEAAAPHPAVIRTYDLGGEKGIGPAPGENPALGLRGLRYCLAHPDLFSEQLTALCLASRRGELRILLPMVTSLSEIAAARSLLQKAAYRAGLDQTPPMGVMVEVPSAALLADRLAEQADFFSIGTNDLTQYCLAVDRADPGVSPLYRPLHPAVLRLIAMVIDAGGSADKPVAVCGELAGDPVGAAVLVGLGIRDLSATPVAIPRVKEHLCAVDAQRLRALAEKALESSEASEVARLFTGERA